MSAHSHRDHVGENEEKKATYIELIAASSIFAIVAVVLYMVFTYQPS